jgi:hypothetical protein
MYDRISDIKLKRTDTTLDLSQKAVDKKSLAGYPEEIVESWGLKRRTKESWREKKKKRKDGEVVAFYLSSTALVARVTRA